MVFACNLIPLALLAPFATYWFQLHMQFYFAGIVLVGGGITVLRRSRRARLHRAAISTTLVCTGR
jgi:hypothetical protein